MEQHGEPLLVADNDDEEEEEEGDDDDLDPGEDDDDEHVISPTVLMEEETLGNEGVHAHNQPQTSSSQSDDEEDLRPSHKKVLMRLPSRRVNLAIQTLRDNSVPMVERVHAMNQLLTMSEAPADDLARFLAGRSLSLSNPLNDECSSYQKLLLVQCLLTVLRDDHNQFTPEMKESAMDILRNLSRFDLNRIYLYGIPRFVDILSQSVHHAESAKIKELALVTLNNLALDEFIASSILYRPGFLEMYINSAEHGETPGIRRWALGNLRNLAVAPANALRMCDPPFHVDEAIIRCVRSSDNCAEVKETALWGLVNLSCGGNNRVRLLSKPMLAETLVEAAGVENIQRYALRCILSFSYAPENLPILYHKPCFMEMIEQRLENLDTLLRRREKVSDPIEDSFRILNELACDTDIARDIYSNRRRIVYALLNVFNAASFRTEGAILTEEQQLERLKLRSWSLTIFKSLGGSTAHLHYFNMMVTLCCVRGVPKLGRNSLLRHLNVELIRELGKMLAPKPT